MEADEVESVSEYTRGPVKLRRGSIPLATTDQHLLDARPHDGWTHTDPWRVLRIQAEFVEAFDTWVLAGTGEEDDGASLSAEAVLEARRLNRGLPTGGPITPRVSLPHTHEARMRQQEEQQQQQSHSAPHADAVAEMDPSC